MSIQIAYLYTVMTILKENRNVFRIKQRIKFDFLSLDHYELTYESVIRLLPRSVESESWKLESRSQQSKQQAAEPLASPHERCSSKTRC